MIPQSTISDILEGIDLPDFIGEFVTLTRRGTTHEGLCPFHAEETPSFKVFSDHYHCFGCKAHGNALEFVMRQHGLSFPEAVRQLAARAGIILPDDNEQASRWAVVGKDERDALRYACARYHQVLLEPAGHSAMQALADRGVEVDAIVRFGLGCAPEVWGFLSDERRFKWDVLVSAGLAVQRKEGKKGCYDFFRNRLMFPVRDPGGDVIGFGARRLSEEGPKYLNSPETPVYQKGRVLFGWPQAANAVRMSGKVIVCEGFFDVIVPSQAGIENIVSTCGTALTVAQAEFLLAGAHSVVFCFDGDAAGAKATWRTAELLLPLLAEHHEVLLCRMPAGHDPDSLVRESGKDALLAVIENAPTLCQYLIGEVVRGSRIPEASVRSFAKAAELAASISTPALATFFRNEAAMALGLSLDEFLSLERPLPAAAVNRACPCCQSAMEAHYEGESVRVACSHCEITTPFLPTLQAALAVWNRRERPSLGIRYKNEEENVSSRVRCGDACATGT